MHNAPRKEPSLTAAADDAILAGLVALVRQSRRVESELVAHLAEADARRLHAREGFPSTFAYCTESLHLSEAEAYLRITVARASREHPVLLAMLGDGRLHLSGIAKLSPHLTQSNRDELLRRATYKSKRQILELIADLAPRPDVPAVVRRLPEGRTPDGRAGSALSLLREADAVSPLGPDAVDTSEGDSTLEGSTPAPCAVESVTDRGGVTSVELGPERAGRLAASAPAAVVPLDGARYRVQFTATARLRDKLDQLRALMRQEVPNGDLASIIEKAVTAKIEQIERRRHATTDRPRTGSPATASSSSSPSSRHIPAPVRRAVHERDGNRCGFVSASGRRCAAHDALEYHHRHPFGMGGSHEPDNIGLLCRSHNAWLAEQDYGRDAMRRTRERRPARERRPQAPH
jgi:hypothetical protein